MINRNMSLSANPRKGLFGRKWWFLLILIVFTTQSCFSFKTLYTWADTYFSNEIDNWFDMNADQEEFVDRQLDEIFKQHRQIEVPKYAEFLKEVNLRLDRQITVNDIEWFRTRLKQFNTNIAFLLAEDTATFLHSLEDSQVVYLENKMAEENEEWQEEHVTASEGDRQERMEERLDRFKNWIGDLTREQENYIISLYPPQDKFHQVRFLHRLQYQQRFLKLIKSRLDQKRLKEQLLEWYLNPEQFYSGEYQQLIRDSRLRTQKIVLFLDRTATQEQRQHLKSKIEEYIIQVEELING